MIADYIGTRIEETSYYEFWRNQDAMEYACLRTALWKPWPELTEREITEAIDEYRDISGGSDSLLTDAEYYLKESAEMLLLLRRQQRLF